MKFAITTLGCKVNQYESQLLRESLVACGHREQPFDSPGAEVYIVNTCTVTHRSDAQARNLLRRALKHKGRVVATGCLARVYPDQIRAVSPDIEVVPFEALGEALGVDLLTRVTGFHGHSRAFVIVQQGCSNSCTYCVVPHARGLPRSRPWQEVVEEIGGLYEAGFREAVISGINIGLYQGGLAFLLQKILENTPMPRIRISSIEPWILTDELIHLASGEPRICRHLHVPLQSGSDDILARMGRPYGSGYFRSLVEKILSLDSGIAVGTDVVVGFPGEGEREFEHTRALLEEIGVAYLHVFPFSPRPGTPAASWGPRPDPRTVGRRVAVLRDLSCRKRERFIRSQLGSLAEVLVTHMETGFFEGITSNYLSVRAKGEAGINDLAGVLLEEFHEGRLLGRAVG